MSFVARTDSQASVASIGIGTGQPKQPNPDDETLPRLFPEGGVPNNQGTYDCIVYLIYCSVHDRIAVTNVERTRVVWFPFVALPEGVTWDQASLDGISMLIGKSDAELDAKLQAGKLPKFQMSNLHVLRVQIPSERFFIRLAQFVSIDKTENYRCCEKTSRLAWIQASDILGDRVELLWGPEVKLFTTMLICPEQKFIFEFSLDNALTFLMNSDRTGANSYQSKLLASAKIQAEHVMDMYEDYVDHCFPSFYMSLESFKAYLIRYGFPKSDSRFPWLFNAVGYSRKGYIDFNEFLIGIVCMEPTTEHSEGRFRLLFRYYDVDNDNFINVSEFVALLQDLNPSLDPDHLRSLLDRAITTIGFVDKKLSFEAFQKAIINKQIAGTAPLCRSPKTIVPQVRTTIKLRAEERVNLRGEKSRKNLKRRDRGICNGCKAQKYDYGLHCVYFDTNGRCVKPLRLKDVKFSTEDPVMSAMRYSAEFIFGIGSICNMFIDVVRDMYHKNEQNGLMANVEEAPCFARYLRTLCENVSDLVISEEKLMKINAPAMVIGDILGNIDCLFTMEKLLWQSIPILPNNLVFLGNYIGTSRFGVEVICYLFALKMLSPNKVFLLRGFNEVRDANLKELLLECNGKYGVEIGKYIWDSINEVFDKLPFAVLVDESIICLHSGIPKSASRLPKFLELPEEISNVEKESPLAYEIINNIPNETERSQSEKVGGTAMIRNKMEFNLTIFVNFMKANNLSYMIRGHEQCKEGYRLNFSGKCITINTNDNNNATVVFIDSSNCLIRVVKLACGKTRTASQQTQQQMQ